MSHTALLTGPVFDLARVRQGVRPFRLHYYPRLRSTSDHAVVLRRRGELFAPAVVLAGRQTAGRGRAGRTWWSGPGCLTVTFALPVEEHLAPYQVPLVAGLAVRNAVAQISGIDAIGLKWPNDLVHKGLKLAGLLCERIDRLDLVGVGLNVNLDPAHAPAALRGAAGSMSAAAGRRFDLSEVLIAVAGEIDRTFVRRRQEPFAGLVREYERHHILSGRRIVVATNEGAVEGRCEGLDDRGRLLVRQGDRLHRLASGHVEGP